MVAHSPRAEEVTLVSDTQEPVVLRGNEAVIPRLSREKVLQRFRVLGAEVKRLHFVMLVQPDDVIACVSGINSHDAIDVDVALAALNELHDVVDLVVCLCNSAARPLPSPS